MIERLPKVGQGDVTLQKLDDEVANLRKYFSPLLVTDSLAKRPQLREHSSLYTLSLRLFRCLQREEIVAFPIRSLRCTSVRFRNGEGKAACARCELHAR